MMTVVYSQLDESEGDDQEIRVDRCDVLCGGGDHWRACFSVRPTHRNDDDVLMISLNDDGLCIDKTA